MINAWMFWKKQSKNNKYALTAAGLSHKIIHGLVFVSIRDVANRSAPSVVRGVQPQCTAVINRETGMKETLAG